MDLSPIDSHQTALVLIDFQRGIVGMPTVPHTGFEVLKNAVLLADRFRQMEAPVVLVRVTFSADGKDALNPDADAPHKPGPLPPDWAEIAPELGPLPGDIVITKRQWGAFHGTELDLQLRRRGITRIVLGGISTAIGVESTARDAFELGYHLVFVEDAMASMSEETHLYPIRNIFPRIGRIRSAQEVLAACTAPAK